MRTRQVILAGAILVLSAGSATAADAPAGPRDPAIETVADPATSPDPQARFLAGMNPFVLTNLVSSRVVVEVDRVEGYAPSASALRAIAELLHEHCEEGKQVEVLLDDEIPRAAWEQVRDRAGLEALVARHLDRDPTGWDRAELVYVLYVPDSALWQAARLSGLTESITFARSGAPTTVRTVLIFTDELRRDAMLWITPAKIERATLVHELGHVMGLVSDATHALPRRPDHCRNARCAMHRPGVRAGFVNGFTALLGGRIPTRFGRHCVEQIERAKRLWRERAAASPDFVRRMRAERLFRENKAAEAWRARRGPE